MQPFTRSRQGPAGGFCQPDRRRSRSCALLHEERIVAAPGVALKDNKVEANRRTER